MKKLTSLLFLLSLLTSVSLSAQGISDSLKAHFEFDGNILDYSIYKDHLTSSQTLNYQNVTSIDQAVIFNGSSRAHGINSFDNSTYNEASVSLWFNTSTFPSGNDHVMIQGAYMGFAITVEPNGKASGFFSPPSWNAIESTSDVIDGNWHHIIITNDGTTTRLYIDGQLESFKAENMQIGNGASNNRLYLGATNLNSRNYNGLLNDVRIYNRALTQIEIDTLSGRLKTSLAEFNRSNQTLNTFPNPSTGIFYFVANKEQAGSILTVRNLLGSVVIESNIEKDGTHSVNLEGETNGIYFIEIISSNGNKWSSKILKK